jgi:flavin reductase (DIM6/NTAB) family NADH-FMN oxidoreductase RutF
MRDVKDVDVDQIRLIQPSIACLVSSSYGDSTALITVGWIMPVSYVPSRVAISISPERYSYNIIDRSGMFAVNIMEYNYIDAVYKAGTVSGRDIGDKFRICGLSRVRGRSLSIPVVGEALGVLECKVINKFSGGDHDIFVGEVVDAYVKGKYTTHWDASSYRPILYISEGHFMTIDPGSVKKYEI